MSGSLDFYGLSIYAPTTRCAHTCRYCSIGRTEFSHLPFSRFAAMVDRFVDWRASHNSPDFKLWCWPGNSFDYEPETMAGLPRLWAKTGQLSDGIATGGVRWRPEGELRDWLSAWRDLGITRLHSAFAGHSAVHDGYNGRVGDFEFLTTDEFIDQRQSFLREKKTLA